MNSIYPQARHLGTSFCVVSWNALIPTEKAYETWKKGRQDKSSFPVLDDDANYKRWKQDFEAEMDHQEVSRVVNKDFDPTVMRCSFDIALYEHQKKYLWTVLIAVLTLPLGGTCIQKYQRSCDSRAAYLEHERLQKNSKAVFY